MTDTLAERIREIKEREAKATKGPWTVGLDTCARCRDEGKEGEYDILQVPSGYHAMLDLKEDAEFISQSRADVPWLIEQLEKALSELSAAEEAARKEEREACCKAVCVACRMGARLIHTDAGTYKHEEGYCAAAAIRNRE